MATPPHGGTATGATTAAPPAFRSLTWRLGDALAGAAARAGIGPMHLLTTRGRRTGRAHTVPVVPVHHDGREWLVAPYGAVAWVHNARADGRVLLRHGRRTRARRLREVPASEAGPVLKRYVAVAAKTRSRFRARPDAPVDAFTAEAADHPVFEVLPADADDHGSHGP